MNQKIKEHLVKYASEKFNLNDLDEDGIIEFLRDMKTVWVSGPDSHRWWDIHTFVVDIDGMFIGFDDAISTGDMSPNELGYEFDKNSIKEYQPKEIKTIIFEPKH